MPSASAKIEKVASVEAADPMKQVTLMMEKKVRNLEKRKLKLDNYKNDVTNGKELNEDQKIAVNKYDQVLDLLEFAKEVNKSCNAIVMENAKAQKKLAKKEQIERQQHEIQRLQEAFLLKHMLFRLEEKEVREDFLNGHNGAIQLPEEHLNFLSQLYKLVEPNLPNEQGDVESHFHSLAEHTVFLLDGKNKEVAGTTYKHLKELLCSVKESGYFTRTSENAEEETLVSGDEVTDTENCANGIDMSISNNIENTLPASDSDEMDNPKETHDVTDIKNKVDAVEISSSCVPTVSECEMPSTSINVKKGSLQEVLSSQGSFNFLQESQIDLESPHMDPAVVAVHHMAPETINFNSYAASQPQQIPEELHNHLNNSEPDHCEIPVPPIQQQMPVLTAARGMAPVLASVQHGSPHDFDPSHPIPTQTFTNQSFAVMQNMMMPSAYVPVTMHHGPIPPHMTPLAVVPGISPTVAATSTSGAVPMHVTVAPIPVTATGNAISFSDEKNVENTAGAAESQVSGVNSNGSCDTDDSRGDVLAEKPAGDSEGFTTQNNFRSGYRGRGRGRGPINGYYRGRNGYNGRGGHQGQNSYYSQGSHYNGFRRGNSRGGPRGASSQRAGRGSNYRAQGPGQQQQQREQ